MSASGNLNKAIVALAEKVWRAFYCMRKHLFKLHIPSNYKNLKDNSYQSSEHVAKDRMGETLLKFEWAPYLTIIK